MSVFDDVASAAASTARLYARGLQAAERIALGTLRARMDAAAPAAPPPDPDRGGPEEDGSPAELMARLLDRSLRQDSADSRRELHVAVLRQLMPDEARILAALAEGKPAPLVHVLPRAGGDRLLENASLIGRTAALTLPRRTPSYITHLRSLELVDTGPEDPAEQQGYELLMADRDVRDAMKAGELSKLPAKTVRRTLTLTDLGRELCAACGVGDVKPAA